MSYRQTLGRCPHCDGRIGPADVLIEYTRENERTHYVECPSCETVVRPA